ncbi:MAG: aminodeoxychorismate/anthranilate synthase component II [archaeon]|jgi:anthranilate synthase/aminodeoxychorismate synthase-like glutamine amidotransferase|nr:aminodeoxychorismate/anthranilate synthase component II [archaeon]
MNVLFIDNFDSFTYNLVDEFAKRGCQVRVYRNNTPLEKINQVVKDSMPRLIVISPGPSSPSEAGNSIQLIKEYAGVLPIFGVCLGHQCIVEAFGGEVGKAPEIVHGKPSSIEHDGKSIFRGLENPFQAGRYHSLTGLNIPSCLEVSANSERVVMGVRHKKYFIEGVQFHPESILTREGGKIIENLIAMCGD